MSWSSPEPRRCCNCKRGKPLNSRKDCWRAHSILSRRPSKAESQHGRPSSRRRSAGIPLSAFTYHRTTRSTVSATSTSNMGRAMFMCSAPLALDSSLEQQEIKRERDKMMSEPNNQISQTGEPTASPRSVLQDIDQLLEDGMPVFDLNGEPVGGVK